MIKKLCFEGNLEDLKQNKNFIDLIKDADKSKEEYIIGVDLAPHGSNDCSIMCKAIEYNGKLILRSIDTL